MSSVTGREAAANELRNSFSNTYYLRRSRQVYGSLMLPSDPTFGYLEDICPTGGYIPSDTNSEIQC